MYVGHPAQLTFVIDIEKTCVYINMKCGDNEQCYILDCNYSGCLEKYW